MREKILQGMAECAWWLAWSDHVEEHGCYNLSGCEISQHAPDVPKLAYELAEKALAKVEAAILAHKPLAGAIKHTKHWLQLYSEPAHSDDILKECESPVCGALLVAAHCDTKKEANDDPAEDLSESYLVGAAKYACLDKYTDAEYALRFGRCITYDLVGAGVAWSDDHEEIPWPRMYDSFTDELNMYAEETCEENEEEKPSGYTDCKCRDCFNVAMDGNFCSACEDAGCEEDSECEAEGAYGVEDEEP